MSMEIKSKSQLRVFLNTLVVRGKVDLARVTDMVDAADLPEYVGNREGRVRKQLGGYRQNRRMSGVRRGSTR